MTRFGITGIYSPFTGEANLNTAPPPVFLPFTMCHEMAHQRGYAREDEANFIAYLVCKNHEDAEFRYSGYLMAFQYAMNKLYTYSPEKFQTLRSQISEGIKRDLVANRNFWHQYQDTVAEKVSTKINDTFLKANRQSDGVHSYGRMVDLLIAEYENAIKFQK